MRLSDWLEKNKLSDAAFGARCKPSMHRVEVWNYKTGRRIPRADKVAAIEEVTRGQVRAKDFVTRSAA